MGGFTFYGGVLISTANQVLGSERDVGFVTQQVTNWLNFIGVLALIILGISALTPQGILELWPLVIAAIAGAIAGDALSFWLGRRYHRGTLLRWPLNRYPQFVSRSEAFFQRYGNFSVFLARFTPAVRAFVPLVAGIFQMRTDRFYIANVLSALVWAPLHVFPGVLVGTVFSMAGAAAGRLAASCDAGWKWRACGW